MIKISPKIKKIIQQNPISVASVGRDGKPNISVVAFAKVVSENEIIITER